MIEIKNRWTGAVIRSLDAANLIAADLSGANLSGANLIGANLRGANLIGANLSGADLRGADLIAANLIGANLSAADLSDANLSDANLSAANLSAANLSAANLIGANLIGANLRGANLIGANLSDANLRGADLIGANLRGIRESLGIEFDPSLPGRVVAQITEHPETHDQKTWHSQCGTKHCVAGWTTMLAGHLGKYLDKQFGTPTAATLLLWQPGRELPSFAPDATEEETIGRLLKLAEIAP